MKESKRPTGAFGAGIAAIVVALVAVACSPALPQSRVENPISALEASTYMTEALAELDEASVPAVDDAGAFLVAIGPMAGWLLSGAPVPLDVASLDSMAAVTQLMALLPAQGGGPEITDPAWVWTEATEFDPSGYYPTLDEALQPEAPYDIVFHGHPDVSIDLMVAIDVDVDGSSWETIDLGGETTPTELPTNVLVSVFDGATEIGSLAFSADWAVVTEDRCTTSSDSLTARSLDLSLVAGEGSVSFSATATPSESTLSLRIREDSSFFGLGFDVSIPDEFRVTFNCEDYAPPFGGPIGAIPSFEASAFVDIGSREVAVATTTALTYDEVPELASIMLDGILSMGGVSVATFDIDATAPTEDEPEGTVVATIDFEDGTTDIESFLDDTFCPDYFCVGGGESEPLALR